MNRPLIAVIFIIVAVCIAVTSLFYINNTHETMTEHLGDVLESATADNKQETKIRLDNALKEWEKKDDLLNVNINSIEGITIEFAKLLVNIFKSIYGIDCINIKYPNDLLINGKKIGGILTETKLVRDNVKYLIVGIGINTNQIEFENLEIKDIASSIKKECKKEIDNNKVIFEFIREFEKCLKERITK